MIQCQPYPVQTKAFTGSAESAKGGSWPRPVYRNCILSNRRQGRPDRRTRNSHHDLCCTLAQLSLDRRADVIQIWHALGHTTIKTAKKYLGVIQHEAIASEDFIFLEYTEKSRGQLHENSYCLLTSINRRTRRIGLWTCRPTAIRRRLRGPPRIPDYSCIYWVNLGL